MRKMKESGIEWIGDIPEGWEVRKVKNIFDNFNGATPKSDQFEFWNGEIIWITPAEFSENTVVINESKRTLTNAGLASCGTTIVPKDSIIISCRAPIGLVCLAGVPLCTNQGCKSLVSKQDCNIKFFFYFFKVQSQTFNMLGKGTTFLELSSFELNNFIIPYPSLREQQRIADYLDAKCARIDESAELVRQSMEKLRAYKLSLITEAVTKGLDPDVPMKDSGIPWIGKIPISWNCLPLKRVVASVKTGSTPKGAEEKYYAENGLKWFTPADFTAFPYIDSSAKKLSELGINEVKIFPQDSVLLIGIGATMGKVALACSQCAANQQMRVLIN